MAMETGEEDADGRGGGEAEEEEEEDDTDEGGGGEGEGGEGEGEGGGHGGSSDSTPVATVDPRRGRLVLFTSGSEHPHRVSRVTAGVRLALTIAFTCDESAAITDFLGRALDD